MLKGLTGAGRRFTPTGYIEKTRAKFLATGDATSESVDRFLAIKVVTILAMPIWLIWVMRFSGLSGILQKGALGIGLFLLYKAPDMILDRKVLDRQQQIQRALPDILDLLVISVEAGLGFEQALDRTVKAVPGVLSQEFNRMLGEVRAGSSRSEAMRAMEKRVQLPELRAFVMAILQADQFGVSIGHILRGQADEMRIKRRQIAQERAMKAPVKMLLPMVFCIFPSLFLVTLAPAFMNIADLKPVTAHGDGPGAPPSGGGPARGAAIATVHRAGPRPAGDAAHRVGGILARLQAGERQQLPYAPRHRSADPGSRNPSPRPVHLHCPGFLVGGSELAGVGSLRRP